MPRLLDVLSPLEQQVAREFAHRVRQHLGQRVRDIRVFGSRARGQARDDSDMDIWVLLDVATMEDKCAVSDLATNMLLEGLSPFEIAPRVMPLEQHRHLVELERLLPQEIDRDGISL